MGADLRGLRARVRRLEDAVGKGQRNCPYCRFIVGKLWPDPKRAVPDDVFMVTCEFCRSEYPVTLKHEREGERELLRLTLSFTLEDQYTDPRAHAAGLLLNYLTAPDAQARELRRSIDSRAKTDPKARTFVRLRDEITALYDQTHKMLRAKYGDDPFPEQARLIESIRSRERRSPEVYVNGLYELEAEETNYLIGAELEKIIWGQPQPGTALSLERVIKEIDELIRAAVNAAPA
jgi:hypothetical protein